MTDAPLTPISLTLVDADLPAAAAALGDAFASTGFALVSDHGIPEMLLSRAMGAAKALFALPPAAKAAYVQAEGFQRGYTPFGREIARDGPAPDLKEFWHIGRENVPGLPANVWPGEWPLFRPVMLELFAALDHVGQRLLRAIAVHLGQSPDFFEDATKDGNSVLRLLHYPPLQGSEGPAIRAAAHEDINVITLLLGAEEAGLQLLDRNGTWQAITAPPGTLVCNIGDMLQRLTGGRLPSTTHRVVNPAPDRQGRARYSMPYFLHFRPDYRIETMAGGPRSWPPITAGAYLQERLHEIGLLSRD